MRRIVILGPAYPYRGGLARIMERMAREYVAMGNQVRISTFTVQYPSILFPGKSQYCDSDSPSDLRITREVNTCNPFNWIRIGMRLRRESPDYVVLKYWTPFMAPCFGTIARIARGNGHTRFICQIDNVEPHEGHFTDRVFNRFFLRAMNGFVYMSENVHESLLRYTSAPQVFSPHPMFDNFGERVDRAEACGKLGLDCDRRYLLFFGLIRHYKGLDMLLEAMSRFAVENVELIVAGEFYEDREKYDAMFRFLGSRVHLFDEFIPDDDVRYFFSVSDALILPYRTATQSGVTQIAYNFSVPMVVTDVGGLAEIVPDGKVGIVCRPTVDSIALAMETLYSGNLLEVFKGNMPAERRRFSWRTMCTRLLEVVSE